MSETTWQVMGVSNPNWLQKKVKQIQLIMFGM